jgi:acetyltransferase-like isoleucine patch superfamily enzyme
MLCTQPDTMNATNPNYTFRHSTLEYNWIRFWMRFAGMSLFGRIATRLAIICAYPHKARVYLAGMNPNGFISPSAVIHHSQLQCGKNIFMDDRVVIFQRETGGPIRIGDRVYIYRDTIIETGEGGRIEIGEEASIHPRCQVNAYKSSIFIGRGTMLAPGCALYSYDHGIQPGVPISDQPIQSKGDIIIGNDAWLGFGVIVLSGVRIGNGAVAAAGSVIKNNVPDDAIVAGNPARILKKRDDLKFVQK